MAADNDDAGSGRSASGNVSGGPDAFAAAMAHDLAKDHPEISESVANYLRDQSAFTREQARLTRLQSESLVEQNAFELSHLRWRRFNDQMKGALQIMGVMFGALIVVVIAATMWNASRAQGIVVESFSVPPQFVSSGIGGDVVADDLTQKISAIRDFANANSLAYSNSVSQDRGKEVKVEIPDTGVSLAEAWHYLRSWLGHERHLDGNVRTLPNGQLALTVSLGGADTFSFMGEAGDLDALEGKAAERVFASVDPVNYVLYLYARGRTQETLAAASRLRTFAQNDRDLGEANSLYSDMVHNLTGDMALATAAERLALKLDPAAVPQHMEMVNIARALGHDEEVLKQAREIRPLKLEDNVESWRTGAGFVFAKQVGARYAALETGDFAAASTVPCTAGCARGNQALFHAEALARLYDVPQAEALIVDAQTYGDGDPASLARARFYLHAAKGEWRAAAENALGFENELLSDKTESPVYQTLRVHTQAAPLLAHALVELADASGAEAAMSGTPLDCYACLIARGEIAALKRDWTGAERWFSRAIASAPSIPFAYKCWGEMLLLRGAYDQAITNFDQAHEKGPHFADPLEMWGEALIQRNRSDLALAKFKEANRYAPNWGRLHLEWGKALWWSGDKQAAKRQFEIASNLALSAVDTQLLVRVKSWH